MDENKIISLENLNQYSDETSDKIKSYVDTKTSVIQDGTKAVGGVSAEDYNNFKGAYEDKHTHSNKSVLDEISEKTLNGGNELSGSTGYTVTDSVEYPLVGMKVFGKSTQDGTPTPENPVEIVSVVEPTVTVCGKNLLNINSYSSDTVKKNEDGSLFINTNGGISINTNSFVLKANQTYRIYIELLSGTISGVNNSGIMSSAISSDYLNVNTTYTVTKDTDTEFEGIRLHNNAVYSNCTFRIMVWQGTDKYKYEPYTAKTLAIPYTLSGIPVSSGGNIVINGQKFIADYIDFERGVKVSYTLMEVYDGSADEEWSKNTLTGIAPATSRRFTAPLSNNALASNGFWYGFCNSQQKISADSGYGGVTQGIAIQATSINLYFTGEVTTVEELRSYLSNNNVIVLYALATPIETPISESEMQAYRQLHTYNGVTNISNDKGAGIEVSYCTSKALSTCVAPITSGLQKQIDDLKSAVLSLGGNI